MKNRFSVYLLSALCSLCLLVPAVTAAQDTPGPLAEMWVVTPKAGHQYELEEALAEHMKFRAENGDPRAWQSYRPLLGDELDRIGIRFCCITWADVDSYREWSRSNTAISEHLNETVAPHAERWSHNFETMLWSQSHWAESAEDATLYGVTEFHIKPGHEADFRAAREKILQIAINQGWATDDRSWLWTQTVGGSPTEGIVIPYKNFAAMDRDEDSFARFLGKIMGQDEAAALLKTFSSSTNGSNYQIWEHQDELSMQGSD